MRRIGYVHETQADPEVAVLKLSTKEHDDLHKRHQDFVNEQPIFPGKKVKSVELRPESHATAATATAAATAPAETWMTVIMHYPSCRCVATCTPIQEA